MLKSRAFTVTGMEDICYLSILLSSIKAHVALKRPAVAWLLNVHLSHSSICLATSVLQENIEAFKDLVPPGQPWCPPSWTCLKHHPKDTSGMHLCQMPQQPKTQWQIFFPANWIDEA